MRDTAGKGKQLCWIRVCTGIGGNQQDSKWYTGGGGCKVALCQLFILRVRGGGAKWHFGNLKSWCQDCPKMIPLHWGSGKVARVPGWSNMGNFWHSLLVHGQCRVLHSSLLRRLKRGLIQVQMLTNNVENLQPQKGHKFLRSCSWPARLCRLKQNGVISRCWHQINKDWLWGIQIARR